MNIVPVVLALSLFTVVKSNDYGPLCSCKEFRVYTDEVFWPEAKSLCESKGGQLAKISNRAEDEMIKNFLKDSGVENEVRTGFWIGLQDQRREDTFRWLDNDKLGECKGYSNWAPGEPNDNTKKNPKGQDCVQLWKRKDFRWDDEYCEYRVKGYVCEFIQCKEDCLSCTGIEEPTLATM